MNTREMSFLTKFYNQETGETKKMTSKKYVKSKLGSKQGFSQLIGKYGKYFDSKIIENEEARKNPRLYWLKKETLRKLKGIFNVV